MFLLSPDRIKAEPTAPKVEAMEEKQLRLISRTYIATMAIRNVDAFLENQFEMGHTGSADANFYSDRLRDRALHATG